MTSRFEAMWPFIKEVEGTVFENDPDDPGGATKYGIDQRSHPKENIRALTEDRAKEIYWDEYWQANRCEKMVHPLGEAFFDVCVNNGRGRADKLLAITRDTRKFLAARDDFYRRLAAARPRSAKYLKGWLNRNNKLRRHLGL